jgi:hypothetical protein
MAQRVHPISFRLGVNHLWNSEWYSNTNYSSLFFEDNLIKHYIQNIFENRGFFIKRTLIKRSAQSTFIFIEIYANPYFKYAVPKEYRKFTKFQRILKFDNIKNFLQKFSKNKIFISIQNLFIINRIHRNYLKRLRSQFFRYKKYRFTMTILGIFNIILRTKGAIFLTKVITTELEFIEKRKKNKIIWRYISFIGKLVHSIKYQNKAIHGLRIQITGRFKGISRPKKVRFREGLEIGRAHV